MHRWCESLRTPVPPLNRESVRAIQRASKAHSRPGGEITATKSTTSETTHSSTEWVFNSLLSDSVIEVFNGTLGKIAGQALLNVVKAQSPDNADPLRRPDLLDQVLVSHLGLVARVIERKILKTLAGKTASGAVPEATDHFDFAAEVDKVRKQFLERKQMGGQPQTLE